MPREVNPERDLLDLSGKVILITGANRGIGFKTAQSLVRRGAKVYLGARGESKGLAAIAQLEKEGLGSMGGTAHFHEVDISTPKLAKTAGERFLEKETRLDILVHNAALLAGPYEEKDGISAHMLINHFSTFVLTDVLLPLMKQTAAESNSDVRIVVVSSSAHSMVEPETFQGEKYFTKSFGNGTVGGLKNYGISKLANQLYMSELQRRLDSENVPILCISIHPGGVATEGGLGWLKTLPFPFSRLGFFLKTEVQGAMTSAYAAASKEMASNSDKREAYKGAYLVPYGKLEKPGKAAQSEKLASELWDTTEKMVGRFL